MAFCVYSFLLFPTDLYCCVDFGYVHRPWAVEALENLPRFNVRPYRSGIGQHNRNVALYLFVDRGRAPVKLSRFQSLK